MTRTSLPARRTITAGAIAASALLVVAPVGAALAAPADNVAQIDFEGYTLGDPRGQNGWSGYPNYDNEIVDADGMALRFSNATGAFTNMGQLISPRLNAPAGESTTGAFNDVFELSFTVESSNGTLQPGLNLQVAADGPNSVTDNRGTRAGGTVNLRHTDEGLEVWSTWPVPGEGAVDLDDWVNDGVVVDATVPHTITYRVEFVDGDGNDVVSIWVDGVLLTSEATSWEEYHDNAEAEEKQLVDSLLFRTYNRGTTDDGVGWGSDEATPDEREALEGEGFLFRDISFASFRSVPTDPPAPSDEPADSTDGTELDATASGSTLQFEASGFGAYENVALTVYSTPYFAGWFRADVNGNVNGTITLPSSIAPGSHILEAVGETTENVATSGFTLAADDELAETGVPDSTVPLIAAGLLVAAGLGFVLHRRTRPAAV